MTPSEHAAWGRTRGMGLWVYLLRRGMLRKGVTFAALVVGAEWAWAAGFRLAWRLEQGGVQFLWLAVLYGGIIGAMDWFEEEQRYREGPQAADAGDDDISCLRCAQPMSASESRCPQCGWSFEDEGPAPPPRAAADGPSGEKP